MLAEMWTAKREELGHPLGMSRTSAPVPSEPAGEAEQPALGEREDFVLEVGCEELPPDDLSASLRQLSSALPGVSACVCGRKVLLVPVAVMLTDNSCCYVD